MEVAIFDIFGCTSNAAGVAGEGVFGYSFLKHFLVEIDYPTRHLHLTWAESVFQQDTIRGNGCEIKEIPGR